MTQLVSAPVLPIVHRHTPVDALQSDREILELAPCLRQVSRELRAIAEALRERNSEVMLRADEVAARYCLEFGQPKP